MNFIVEFWKRITTALESQLTAITSFMVQIQNWGNRAAQVAQQKVQKAIQTLLRKHLNGICVFLKLGRFVLNSHPEK